jgi:uncharacterized YceG family protein
VDEEPKRVKPRRRARALLLVALGAGVLTAVAVGGDRLFRGSSASTTTTTAIAFPPTLRIVFPEGFTRAEMAARVTAVKGIARRRRHLATRLNARAYLAASARSPLPGRFAGDGVRRPLEGFLFPATYDFTPATTSAQLVRSQLQAFRRNWALVNLRYARSKNLTPYDVLIIASMIEREVKAPSERRLVAAVIYNRLHAHMPLGIDATLRYGLHVPATQALRESQLQSSSPYNTRNRLGLPPTPIANPGLASIQAAAHPAHVPYLYFVRKPDKIHHFFTSSYSAFLDYAQAHGYG